MPKSLQVITIFLIFFHTCAYAELENGMEADVVLGQPDFGFNTANNGGISASTFNLARSAFMGERKIFVTDQISHRVLVWSGIPKSNFAPANVVLGQPDFGSNAANNGGRSASSMNQPSGGFYDGRKLFVTEFGNHRLLIWNSPPLVNTAPADLVIGQPDFSQGTANNGGRSAMTLSSP